MKPTHISHLLVTVSCALLLILCGCREKASSCSRKDHNHASKTDTETTQDQTASSENQEGAKVIKVKYFYSESHRCPSCKRIETLTREAVNEAFNGELESGKMQFSLVDIDKAATKPAMEKYKLFTKSVVVSEYQGEEEIRWQNLEKVWTLLRNDTAFKDYLKKEIKAYL